MQPTIIKSQNDKRDYRVLQLQNKLTCLLISDKDTDKSAASLDVNIGSIFDPIERQGLAHFLEHMLFMGTEKYPDQSEYSAYLSANSGRNNAYTSTSDTNYYLDCANDALYGALDRFAQFFVKPLFDPSCVGREVNAVDSEYQKNVMTDSRRKYQLFRNSALAGHPYNKFSTGNKETLDLPTIREDLLSFYDKYYSANLMKLVVYGKEDLETMEKWVNEFFMDVKNTNKVPEELGERPYNSENLRDFWKIYPVDDKDILEFIWVVDSLHMHYKNPPAKYITHLIGHEGENSLLSYLMDEGLALGLSAGYSNELKLFTKISINVTLTKKGLKEYKRVSRIVFQYLNMLKSREPEKWIFEEIKKINKLSFDFKDKEQPMGYVSGLARTMQDFPVEDVLQVYYLMEEFQPELIKQTINSLTYDNMRIQLISKSLEKECTLTEKWYGTKYSTEPLPEEFREFFKDNSNTPSKSGKKLDLPVPNFFIPESLEILAKEGDELPKYPEKVYRSDRIDVWHKQDNTFRVPKARMEVKLYCKDLGFGYELKTYRLIKLWIKVLNESLREVLYLAQEVKLSVDFDTDSQGLELSITGFNDSINKIAIEIFTRIKEFDPKPYKEFFDNVLVKNIRDLKNFFKKPPYQQAGNFKNCLLRHGGSSHHPEEEVQVAESVTFEDLLDFHRDFFRTVRLESFFIGNITKEKAIEISKAIEEIVSNFRENSSVLPKTEIPEVRTVDITKETNWIFEYPIKPTESGEKESNSHVMSVFQYQSEKPYNRMLLAVLSNYLHNPCFETLRTNEQLGYIVFRGEFCTRGVLHYNIQVQSSKFGPEYLSKRVFAFIDSMKESVNGLSEEEFQKYVESVRVKVAQKDLSIMQEGSRYWDQIITHRYEFNRKEINLEELKKLKREDFVELFNELFYKSRRLLEVHLVSPNHLEANTTQRNERLEKEKSTKLIKSVEWFKRVLPLYPDFYSQFGSE